MLSGPGLPAGHSKQIRHGGSAALVPTYRARTKGKVERPIRYIRESFFYGRSLLVATVNFSICATQNFSLLTCR